MRGSFRFLEPYWPRFLLALAQVFVISGIELLRPWPLQIVIDHALGGRPWQPGRWRLLLPSSFVSAPPMTTVLWAGAALILLSAASGGMVLLHNRTAIGLGQRMVNDLRGRIYAHLQRLSLTFHSTQRVGDLMMRINHDSFAVQTMIMNGALPILSAVVLLMGIILVLAPIDPLLTAVALSISPVLFVLISLFNRRIAAVATDARDRDTLVYSLIQWGMGAIKYIQAFTREEEEHARFMQASDAALRSTLSLYSWQTLYSGAVNVVVAGGTAAVICVGAHEVLNHALSLGQLLVFTAYLAQLYAPINQITQSSGLIAGARVGVTRCMEILETEPDLVDGQHELPADAPRSAISWQGVSFRYRPETPVLRDVDLEVAPGEMIALVGATGAGKSTLLSLLPRFFDATSGRVLIDGVDIREFRLRALRGRISMVLQPPLVFPLSVRDNIAYGRPDATQDEIERAAARACIDERIASLPRGYDTLIGESGISLSEGEKQRITIARALLRDAPILILDEPTSALDVATEALVMAAIERLTAARTTFVIAHRLSTVRRADRILVLADGGIAEAGSFEELLARDGLFASLYRTQFESSEEALLVPPE